MAPRFEGGVYPMLVTPVRSGARQLGSCERTRSGCTAVVYVTLSEYVAVRADLEHFVTLPEHVDPDSESVVREADRFVLIERFTDPTALLRPDSWRRIQRELGARWREGMELRGSLAER